ncbi:hypothetical protein Patl1_18463 [Pistacia atlantica]|uniref:Uncharacterized protein n=1 Tax=Pistacia atlantica TaxID=434234 RepID=A0ACC1C2W4_9ROSI|nr:hypothetical protein Patl1_18463 [Pistacia atlantica]
MKRFWSDSILLIGFFHVASLMSIVYLPFFSGIYVVACHFLFLVILSQYNGLSHNSWSFLKSS